MKRLSMLLSLLAATSVLGLATHAQESRPAEPATDSWTYYAEKYDSNKDGKIAGEEYTRGKEAFARLDKNADGSLTAADFAPEARGAGRRPAGQAGRGAEQGGRARATAPKVGDVAPDFELPVVGAEGKTVKLSSFKGKRPVALIFGSYT